MRVRGLIAISVVAALVVVAGVSAAGGFDWGATVEKDLNSGRSNQLFGVDKPLLSTSTTSLTEAEALAHPEDLVTLAKSLKASVVAAGPTDNVGVNADQMVLWPPSNPTHIILVNEEGTGEAGLQKVDLSTGKATTILTGIDDNDPVRATPWGTIIFGEEATDGAMYEIIDPLNPALEGTVLDRAAQTYTPATTKIKRLDALGFNAFEGLAILPNGVTYYGNELAAMSGAPGGAYYKFVPSTPWRRGARRSPASRSRRTRAARSPRCGSARAATTARGSRPAPARGSS